jgi:MarR family 2-MHQ and catechol resistance regulon transcriptional repressor
MGKGLRAETILFRATRSLENIIKEDIESYGLNTSEFGVLELLYHKGPQPMNTLSSKLLLASSSMTYVVDNLIKRNYVIKYSDDLDRRKYFVKLTAKGEDYIKMIFPKHKEKIEEIFSVLSAEELDNLLISLKKIGYYSRDLNSKKEI